MLFWCQVRKRSFGLHVRLQAAGGMGEASRASRASQPASKQTQAQAPLAGFAVRETSCVRRLSSLRRQSVCGLARRQAHLPPNAALPGKTFVGGDACQALPLELARRLNFDLDRAPRATSPPNCAPHGLPRRDLPPAGHPREHGEHHTPALRRRDHPCRCAEHPPEAECRRHGHHHPLRRHNCSLRCVSGDAACFFSELIGSSGCGSHVPIHKGRDRQPA